MLTSAKIKGVWPVSPRDTCELLHWRVMEDGGAIFFHFSVADDAKPVDPSGTFVRADNIVMGYYLRPTEDGLATEVFSLMDSDPQGSLPAFLINQAVLGSIAALENARTMIAAKTAAGELRDVKVPASYEDFVTEMAKALK